jgi:serine/threonine protein kinase
MYFSPEQTIMGAEVGPQSDVWALGILIFHCITGTLPFGRLGDSIEVIVHEIRSKGVPNLIAASQQRASLFLREVVEGALKKNTDERTANAAAMLSQLENALRAGLSKFASSVANGGGADISQSGLAAMVRAGRGPGSVGGGSLLRVKELQEQLERSQREIAVKKDEIEGLESQLHLKTQQMETLSARLNELSDELPQSKKQLNVQRDHLAVSQHELRAKANELEQAQRELGIKSEEMEKIQRLLNTKTADMITAEKKLLDRNEKIHKLFRQLSGQRDDYENKLQDLQQVCDDYEAEMEDLRQTMDEFFNSQEDWIHRDQLKALTDTIQRLQAEGGKLGTKAGGGARNTSGGPRGSKAWEMEEDAYHDEDDFGDEDSGGDWGGGGGIGGQSGRGRGTGAWALVCVYVCVCTYLIHTYIHTYKCVCVFVCVFCVCRRSIWGHAAG